MNKKKVLIVDDDPAILDILSLMLENEGYAVETAINGETVRELKGQLPDLILLDIWMSGIDGRDICIYLKSQEHTKHIPIIMVSASKDAKQIAKDAGADSFIGKPFEMEDLLAESRKFINKDK